MSLSTFGKEKYTYWTQGDKNYQPLILLPGFTGTHEDLVDFAQAFSQNYFVVIPDFPGWGKSPVGDYDTTIAGYAAYIKDILTDLKIDRKIILFGHCMGSLVAIEFVHENPNKVKSLFLVGVPFMRSEVSGKVFHILSHAASHTPRLFRPLLYLFRSRLFAIPLGFFVIQTRSLREKLAIIFKNSIKQQFQQEDVVEKNWDSMVFFDFSKISHITIPLHLFHGAKDILIPSSQAKKLQALCSHATLDILPNSGHMPPVETPQALAIAMKKYL